MAHKSRIAGFPLSSDRDDLVNAIAFWGSGLELELPSSREAASGYLRVDPDNGVWQRLSQPSDPSIEAQLDIETDNLEAEAARLEELGARRIAYLRQRWWMLQLPDGQRLRIVPALRSGVGDDALPWA